MQYTIDVVKYVLHLEGLIVLLGALYFYSQIQGNWWIFAALIFTPDIAMVGYLLNKRVGSYLYNVMHNYLLAVGIIAVGYFLYQNIFIVQLGIILVAHVGMDRFFGYGLKYPSGFKDTHMQRV